MKYNKIIALIEVCMEEVKTRSLPREGSIWIGTCRPSRSLKGEQVRESPGISHGQRYSSVRYERAETGPVLRARSSHLCFRELLAGVRVGEGAGVAR